MATYYIKSGTSTFGRCTAFSEAKSSADTLNRATVGFPYRVTDGDGTTVYPLDPIYTVKNGTTVVNTYTSFTDAFNAAKSNVGYTVCDVNDVQVYPKLVYYWSQDDVNRFLSNDFNSAVSISNSFKTMVRNFDYKVYDNLNNVIYPKITYYVASTSGSATEYSDFASAKIAALADSSLKVYDAGGNVLFETPADAPLDEVTLNTMLSEIYAKASAAKAIIDNGILEE